MARPRSILDTHGHGDRIADLLEAEPPGITRERLLAIQAALEGEKKIAEIAKDLGRSQQTISSWMKWFREEGIPGLLERPGQGKGRESELPPSLRKKLLKKVAKGSFRRAKDVKKWLDGRKGARKEGYGLGAVYKYLKMCGASLKVPRPRNKKKNEAAAASFKSTLARKIHELGLPKNIPLKGMGKRRGADRASPNAAQVLGEAWLSRTQKQQDEIRLALRMGSTPDRRRG